MNGGVTTAISAGEVHLPGRPRDIVGLKALAIVAAKAYANFRPGGVKVEAGAPILELGLNEADFAEMASAGVKLIGEIGLGTVKTGHDAAPMVRWAKQHGMTVTIHTGGPSIAGSSPINAEVVLEARPHVVGHINGGTTSMSPAEIEGEPEVDMSALDTEDWSRHADEVEEGRLNIAIVGVATRFPGDINTPDEMWQALLEGRDAITDLPEGRWSEFLDEPRIAERVAKARTRGGYLSDIKGFDAEFFALSKMEADNIDPQQRMALELTWEALGARPHPGVEPARCRASASTSAARPTTTASCRCRDPSIAHPYAITGTASSIIANRVSYFYDFRGPSMAIDTACSSSLVAAHEGVKALRAGEADVVLAGGVNALITPMVTIGFDEVGGVLAPDGRIKSFSPDADGYARSEGGGMLVLKRVADARRDGDEILAVIAGSAVNHDGRSNGLLAPNPDAQAEVLRKAYKDAGIDPRTVDYIEAHGTGTILGDPIEADALGRVVGRGRAADQPALLGAVKSNVGHLESAAGAASLAKMTLALKNDKLPPSINYAGPNPYIDFDEERLKVADTVTDWPRYSGTRDRRRLRLRLRRRQRAPGAARGAAAAIWSSLNPNGARRRGKPRQPTPTRCTSAGSGWTSTASSSHDDDDDDDALDGQPATTMTSPNCPG